MSFRNYFSLSFVPKSDLARDGQLHRHRSGVRGRAVHRPACGTDPSRHRRRCVRRVVHLPLAGVLISCRGERLLLDANAAAGALAGRQPLLTHRGVEG